MKLSCEHLNLPLLHPFTLGNGSSRTHTAISLVRLEHLGIIGIGEAAMPPYLGESHESVNAFLEKIDVNQLQNPADFSQTHQYIDSIAIGNSAIKAAIDIALYDWLGKQQQLPLSKFLQTDQLSMPPTTGTIGITPLPQIELKVSELIAAGFQKIKVKLGGPEDQATITEIRKHTDLPLTVDVNQGWTDLNEAVNLSFWLANQGVVVLEQPFNKADLNSMKLLKEKSPIPVFADESCQRLADIDRVAPNVDGINIKLMKSTGIREAMQMVEKAKSLGLKTMLGCMTETSCATYAAVSIAPLFDFVDIDGPWILKEQHFEKPLLQNGRLVPSAGFGLGL